MLVHNECGSEEFINNWKAGEDKLKKMYGGKQHYYQNTDLGKRFIDQYANKIAHESKVGIRHSLRELELKFLRTSG